MASVAVSLICAVIIMMSFDYVDGKLTSAWSMQLLDCIFGKTDMEFYHYSEQCMGIDCCDKTILMMLPISIWNIPLWILREITKKAFFAEFGSILWMKAGYILCIVLIAVECSKIVKKVNPESDHLLVYPLIFGSFDIIDSTMYACQDEIIYVLMLVFALRKLLDGKTGLFLLFAVITVSLNPEMLIPVFLMILLTQKRILHVLGYTVLAYIPSAAFSLVYRSNDVYSRFNWMDKASGMMKGLFTTDIGLTQEDGNVSLFIVVLCLLVFFAYTNRDKNTDTDVIWTVGASMTGMTLLSSGSFMNLFYRSFLYVPFLLLTVLTSKKNLHTNLILFVLYTWFRGWLDVLNASIQNFSSNYLKIDNDFTRRVFDKVRIVSPGRFISNKIPILSNYGLFTAICLSLAIVIFYINYKGHREREYETFKPHKDILVFVSGLFVPLIIALFCYSMFKSDRYDKLIQFGSDYTQNYYEEAVEFDFYNNNGVSTYAHNIVYDDGICLMNGEDRDGRRLLYSEGASFGPYIKLYPGYYQVIVEGSGLENASFDCTYNDAGIPNQIPTEVTASGDGRIIYTISIEDITDNVELRFFNNTEETVAIDFVMIQETK